MITFPEFRGLKCNMMPFLQGDSSSIPEQYRSYANIIKENYLEKGRVGYLTIDESYVETGKSQRGYNSGGSPRNVHIEVGRRNNQNSWGTNECSWGGKGKTLLDDDTMVLISNSISDTCRVFDVIEKSPTLDGDLSHYIDKYPESAGRLMKAGEVARISIFTPHECIAQKVAGPRQFFRIVGDGVHGRESYFTINPLFSAL